MNYKIDIKKIIDKQVHIQGWVLPDDMNEKVSYEVFDSNNNKIDFKFVAMKRQDVEGIYLGKEVDGLMLGFDILFPYVDGEIYKIIIKTDNDKITERLSKEIMDRFNSQSFKKREIILNYFNKNTFKRAFEFLCKEGIVEFVKKTKRKVKGLDADYDYDEWYHLTKTSDEELDRQKNNYKEDFKILPFFSIVIPVYDTDDNFLKLLMDSILNQTYQEFEVCICDATPYSGEHKNNPKNFFEKLNNDKIHIIYNDKNNNIANNTNIAISIAKGDYIVLCDHDDELTLDALYENAKAINEKEDIEFIYSDEDKVDLRDDSFFEPNFKSDFNLDMLLSVNYICHLSVIKKTLLEKIKISDEYLRKEYNGAQDYDLFLRAVSNIINTYNDEKKIYHIKKVLYHWRCHKNSTAKNVDSKMYAFENGKRAIEDFYKNIKMNFQEVECVEKGFDYGIYHTIYKKNDEPLVSIIIPNKDHIEDLKLTMDSVNNGNYKNIEYIIVENNSTDEKTFKYYEELKEKRNVKVLYYKGGFNFSAINNYGVKEANGEYILFLNNDVEMINKDSIYELVHYIKRDDVGAVGAKLLYKDNTIQHAGVVIDIGGIADHAFKGKYDKDHTYMNRSQIVQDYTAITAACLMTKKEVFNKINGFDEKLVVAFNDIDLCMSIRKIGKKIVYNPYSNFYHYESKSRGLEDTEEKVNRFNKEVAYFAVKWKQEMKKIDEYYNPNLTLRKNDFSLRNLQYEKIGEQFVQPVEIKKLMEEIEKKYE